MNTGISKDYEQEKITKQYNDGDVDDDDDKLFMQEAYIIIVCTYSYVHELLDSPQSFSSFPFVFFFLKRISSLLPKFIKNSEM